MCGCGPFTGADRRLEGLVRHRASRVVILGAVIEIARL